MPLAHISLLGSTGGLVSQKSDGKCPVCPYPADGMNVIIIMGLYLPCNATAFGEAPAECSHR